MTVIFLIPLPMHEVKYCADCLADMVCRYVATDNDLSVSDDYEPGVRYFLGHCCGCGFHWFNRRGERCHDKASPGDGQTRHCPVCQAGPPDHPKWN